MGQLNKKRCDTWYMPLTAQICQVTHRVQKLYGHSCVRQLLLQPRREGHDAGPTPDDQHLRESRWGRTQRKVEQTLGSKHVYAHCTIVLAWPHDWFAAAATPPGGHGGSHDNKAGMQQGVSHMHAACSPVVEAPRGQGWLVNGG
jgi:hypothetical protein